MCVLRSVILLAVIAAFASATNSTVGTCQHFSSGKYVDKDGTHTLATLKDIATASACCSNCASVVSAKKCKAWTFKAETTDGGKKKKAKCELFDSSTLKTKSEAGFSSGLASAAADDDDDDDNGHPTPPPAPTPAPKPTPAPVPTPPPPPGSVKHWAVIAAGSKTFANYRHQADACHAYQIALKNGIPKDNIILMMEDDVANNKENPFPGKLFNRPTAAGTPGVDVYAGCEPTYKGKVVTAQLFLDVLTGNTTDPTRTKVLTSGPHDKVFVNFVDHGGGKIVEFPNGPFMHAEDLNAALTTMHTKGMYDKLVFYMEACNGGSMFAKMLPTDLNIFATTAASPTEPSWGTYCPPQDMVNGKHIKSCLGDLYSVNWMQDSDTATGIKSTLDVQTAMVKKLTNKSHVTEYGTVGTFSATDTCDEYQGDTDNTAADAAVAKTPARDTAAMQHAVDSRDIPLVTAFYQYMWAEEGADKTALAAKLTALVKAREWADKVFGSVVTSLQSARKSSPVLSTVSETSACEKRVYAAVKEHCGWFDEYSLKYSSPLIERCADVPFADIEDVLRKHCTH